MPAGQPAVKTEVAPLAVPGQQPPPLPNVGLTPPAAAATSGGAPVPNGTAGGGAVVPAGGCPPVGSAGSSSQGRKSTLPVQALVHAFHCTDTQCQQKTCADTKQVLKRMEVHVQQCPTRRAQQSAQQGGPPPQQAECKVCKLWQALLRQIDPAQLKQMLISHVRSCKNEQCRTCHDLRERIKSRNASSSHAHEQQPPSTSSSGQHQSVQQPSAGAGRGGPVGYRPSGGPTAQNQEAVRVAEGLTLEGGGLPMLQARFLNSDLNNLTGASQLQQPQIQQPGYGQMLPQQQGGYGQMAERLTLEGGGLPTLHDELNRVYDELNHLPLATAVVAIEPVPPDERERRDSDRRDPRDEQERDRHRDSDTPTERERPMSLKAKKAEVVRLERKVNELVARIAEQERGGNGGDARDE